MVAGTMFLTEWEFCRSVKKTATKRKTSQVTKKEVAARQKWTCHSCHTILSSAYQIDHTRALADGGIDDPSNMTALCPDCHAIKTQHEARDRADRARQRREECRRQYDEAVRNEEQITGNVVENYRGNDGGVVIDPDHLEWFKSKFCYLCNQGKYYDHETRILYTKEQFFSRCVTKKTVVQYVDKMTKNVNKTTYESARLWIKDMTQIEVYFDMTYVPGGSRVIPHPMGPTNENLLNDWMRRGSVPVPNGDCSLFYEWLEMLMPDEATRDWFLNTLAYKYHNPDKKPGVCIQLPGVSGAGKTLLSETLCKALFGSDDAGGTFVQLDGTKSNQLVEKKYNAHISGSDVILVDELSPVSCAKNMYKTMKSIITDKKMMVRRMREDLTPVSSRMLWILTTNHDYAIEIDDINDRRHVIIRCEHRVRDLPDPSEFYQNFAKQMAEGGTGRLVYDIKNRRMLASERADGVDFVPNNFSLLPENLVKEREKAFYDVLVRKTGVDPLNNLFFQTLRGDVHEKAYTETFLKSNVANANGMYPVDWNKINESDCFYYMGKNLYEEYKADKNDGSAKISNTMFSQQLKDIGYVKAVKKLKNNKQADVMWVGFKRKRSA